MEITRRMNRKQNREDQMYICAERIVLHVNLSYQFWNSMIRLCYNSANTYSQYQEIAKLIWHW